ncbi:hypothetical protein TNCT_279861 [Trichonephila clavata]|uniref:Uncharacterized protein n=1 Tax=Trichonephila clavata TaxID=2740835 RepID=A0A8X6FZ07_TRICU|nr:hypothetical protein TNCT_279861 [Trichonephila clavata]
MAQKAWYWLKRKLFPVPNVRVPIAAFFTDVKAMIYADQLTLLDAASFGCSDISELGILLFEGRNSRPTALLLNTCWRGLCVPSSHSPAQSAGHESFRTSSKSPPSSTKC